MGKIKNVLQALKKWIFLEDEEEEFSFEQPRYELKLQFDVPAEKAEAAIRVMMGDLREVLDYAFDGVDIQFFGAEVDEIIGWLTGYSVPQIEAAVQNGTLYGDFFRDAPQLNPDRVLIKGSICGVKLESIEEPLMKEIRYLDKLVDELAKGKAMEKIKRTNK